MIVMVTLLLKLTIPVSPNGAKSNTIMAFYSQDDIFTNFMNKVAFYENIIVNSYVNVALLQCYILAS